MKKLKRNYAEFQGCYEAWRGKLEKVRLKIATSRLQNSRLIKEMVEINKIGAQDDQDCFSNFVKIFNNAIDLDSDFCEYGALVQEFWDVLL